MRKLLVVLGCCLFAASCSSTNPNAGFYVENAKDYYLDGETVRSFDLVRDLGGGDKETGVLTYTVKGSFPKEGEYVLEGKADMEVTCDFRDPLNILNLPESVLLTTYTQDQIDRVIRNDEVQGHPGLFIVKRDKEQARKVFTTPVKGVCRKCAGEPVRSPIIGCKFNRIDQIALVWAMDLLRRATGYLLGGSFQADYPRMESNGDYTVTVAWEEAGKITFRVAKGRGIIAAEAKFADGTSFKLTERPAPVK
jgi:hypothetical protein